MGKTLDPTQSIHTICTTYPQMMEIMVSLGFTDIVKPGMLGTAGRIMTLEKGARMKNIPMDSIIRTLSENGFDVKTTEGGQ